MSLFSLFNLSTEPGGEPVATGEPSAPNYALPGETLPPPPLTPALVRRNPLATNPHARIKVIINPMAGKKGGITTNAAGTDAVREVLRAADIAGEVFETKAVDDATVLALEGLDEKYDLIVACGGDGTVDEVAAGLIGTRGVLGILPLGSANNVARMLHVPFDLRGAAELLKTGEVKRIDVGRARSTEAGLAGKRAFLETAGVGLDAALFPLMTAVDKGAYLTLFQALRTFWRWRPRRMILRLDGRRVRVRALMVLVANGPYWGYSVPLAPDAKVDDHYFDVVVFENISKWELVRHILTSLNGRGKHRDPETGHTINQHVYHPRLRYYRARQVRISSRRPLPVHADARPIGHTPVTFRIQPHALNVVVGRGEHVTS